jgi:hypothetical protein
MRRITKVLLLSLLAALALGLVACGGSGVSDQEIAKAEDEYRTVAEVIERACLTAEKNPEELPGFRFAYERALQHYEKARYQTYANGNYNRDEDEAPELPDVKELGTLSEASQSICPGTKFPPEPGE